MTSRDNPEPAPGDGVDPSDPFAPIGGVDLVVYAAISRELTVDAGGSTREVDRVLAAHRLGQAEWDAVRAGWTSRIRGHGDVRRAFQRLYLGTAILNDPEHDRTSRDELPSPD